MIKITLYPTFILKILASISCFILTIESGLKFLRKIIYIRYQKRKNSIEIGTYLKFDFDPSINNNGNCKGFVLYYDLDLEAYNIRYWNLTDDKPYRSKMCLLFELSNFELVNE